MVKCLITTFLMEKEDLEHYSNVQIMTNPSLREGHYAPSVFTT